MLNYTRKKKFIQLNISLHPLRLPKHRWALYTKHQRLQNSQMPPTLPCQEIKFSIGNWKVLESLFPDRFPKLSAFFHPREHWRLSFQVSSELPLGKWNTEAKLSFPKMHRNPAIVPLPRGSGCFLRKNPGTNTVVFKEQNNGLYFQNSYFKAVGLTALWL